MKLIFKFDNLLSFLLKTLFLFSIIIILNCKYAFAYSVIPISKEMVVEELRLNVPSQFKEAWIKAEKEIWEPWLEKQDGFLGREIFYNNVKEEALILVNWKNRELWKNIDEKEVNIIQNYYEANIKNSLNLTSNPFDLIYEGELDQKQ